MTIRKTSPTKDGLSSEPLDWGVDAPQELEPRSTTEKIGPSDRDHQIGRLMG
jgi:hypothetical protein